MAPVKIIALIFVVVVLIKMLVVFISPASWKAVVKAIYAKPVITTGLSLVMAAVILRYLLQRLTIVEIFASCTFMMALMMAQFAGLRNEVMEMADKFLNDRSILKKVWLSLVIWIILMVWVLYEIFI